MNSRRQLYLGLFVLIALAVLGFYTLFLSDVRLFGETTRLVIHFPEAKGLREGDSVRLAGMRIGRVKTLTYDPAADDARRITVVVQLDQDVVLREGYSIEIQDATLLGGRVVAIEPGAAGSAELPRARYDDLAGTIEPDPLAALRSLGDVFSRNGERIDAIFEGLEEVVTDLRTGGAAENLNATLAELSKAAADVAAIGEDVRAGRGLVGRLLGEDSSELYDTWLGAGREVEDTARAVREGEGLVPRLINDAALADDVRSAVASADGAFSGITDVTTEVREGNGLLPRLLRDEELAGKFDGILTDARTFTSGLSEGKGTLGRLFTSDELYEDVRAIGDNLAQVSGKLARGEGTLGRLIQEDAVYVELELAVKTLNRTLEDLREAAPISTFTSLLFGAF